MLTLEPMSVPLRIDDDGVLRVGGTRITLDVVIRQFQQGASAESIALAFPSLSLTDIYATLTFYLHHRTEVDTYMAEQRVHEEGVRRELDARNGTESIRARLLARQSASGSGQ